MKKVFLGLIATVLFNVTGNAQTVAKKYYACVTTSCCGIGPFGFEIWSQKTCYYYTSSGKATMNFLGSVKDSQVVVADNYLIAGTYSQNGEDLMLPKGNYSVVNNEISFTPAVTKAIVHCIGADTSGTIFGHQYTSHTKYCWTWIWDSKTNISNLTITPEISSTDLAQLANASTEITFDKDIVLKDDVVNYTVKAGKYTLNQDGNIYVQGVKRN